ncbi:glycosyltransferase involved in cell wall biosynthesis [Filimonas zeae]|uniref:Rhamnosyltransferase n=1 Tax=Filimonas zeae TaxID=1737353 RepID=A0A917J3F6_9BACT|nr:DUF1972 domain-containing protein [Filimonas zeae]MDR6341825.1 glycosyltransferase involved in cell wall biosynthesis [Filimonas zeae]GGH80188.1 rhamnosyltransferase [Filimonas zeae]
MNKKHVAIIGTVGVPGKYGGFETLAHNLIIQLKERLDFSVYCSFAAYEEHPQEWETASLKYIKLKANGIQSIPYDIISLLSAVKHADVILVLGVSGAVILPFLPKKLKKRLIVNIDGIEWKRDKWSPGIKAYLKFCEKLAVKHAGVVVADNLEIQKYVEDAYARRSELIEYGADHIAENSVNKTQNVPYAFTVCRIEPENNIHLILEVFAETDYQLKMVGGWNQSDYGRDLYSKYNQCENIELINPIYNQKELDLIRGNARIYIHGHSAGGTNPSLVEAMYLGLPVVAFDVRYNRETTGNKAYFFSNASSLKEVLKNLSDADLANCARDLKEMAMTRYTWKVIAEKYEKVINGVK